MVKHQVLLSVPSVDIVSKEEVARIISTPDSPTLVAVRQDFIGPFSGRALLIFPEANSLELVRVVVGQHLSLEDIVELEDEALAETGNIILNSWISTVANLLKQQLKMSLPVVIRRDQHSILEGVDPREDRVLFLHIKFEISQQEINGFVALMMDIPSIAQLRALIAEFVMKVSRPD